MPLKQCISLKESCTNSCTESTRAGNAYFPTPLYKLVADPHSDLLINPQGSPRNWKGPIARFGRGPECFCHWGGFTRFHSPTNACQKWPQFLINNSSLRPLTARFHTWSSTHCPWTFHLQDNAQITMTLLRNWKKYDPSPYIYPHTCKRCFRNDFPGGGRSISSAVRYWASTLWWETATFEMSQKSRILPETRDFDLTDLQVGMMDRN